MMIITSADYNQPMIEIRAMKPNEEPAAKRVIYRVAHEIFNDPRSLEESIAYFEARGELKDMDDIQQNYFNNRSEEHTSELQSPCNLVCRLLLEKKNKQIKIYI